jgi:hypothetical protein
MGLLDGFSDFIKTPEGQGLLSAGFAGLAGAQRGAPINSIGRAGLAGLQGYGNAMDRQQQTSEAEQMKKYRDMQQQQMQMQIEAAKKKAAQDEAFQSGIGQFIKPGQPALAPLMGDTSSGILPSAGRAAVAPSIDQQGLGMFMAQNGKLEDGLKLLQPKDKKFSTAPQYDQSGRAFILAEDGTMRYLDGVKARDKLVETDLGGTKGFRTEYSPTLVGQLPKSQSPDSKATNQVAWANFGLSKDRLSFDKAGGADGNKPKLVGDQWVTAPSDMKSGEVRAAMPSVAKKDATEALALIKSAREIIPNSTGSYFGAGVDQAARVFGASTGGDTASAQLKAIEGALISKMPKMSGPQSDKDVLLYKQMAGEIGDPTIPQSRKMAALQAIEQIQQRHAGIAPPSMNVTRTNAPTMRWNPKTNSIEMVD